MSLPLRRRSCRLLEKLGIKFFSATRKVDYTVSDLRNPSCSFGSTSSALEREFQGLRSLSRYVWSLSGFFDGKRMSCHHYSKSISNDVSNGGNGECEKSITKHDRISLRPHVGLSLSSSSQETQKQFLVSDPVEVWKILQRRKNTRKQCVYKGNERVKIKAIFDSFQNRGWAADQALAIYINSKVFPTAASKFRKFLMHNMPEDLKEALLSFPKKNASLDAFLFALFSEFCFSFFPVEIKTYRDLVNSADLTKPHTWYPFARAMKRKIIYHRGPTNSGKTYTALQRFREGSSGLYCGPLRLLAMEVYDTMNGDGIYCNLITGQEKKIVPFAQHSACTIEMANLSQSFEVVVIDEIQMIADDYRGWAWTRALLGLRADEIHLCGDESALPLVEKIVNHTGDELETHRYERFKPLKVDKTSLKGDILNVRSRDCIVAFSRREIFAIKRLIESQTEHRCCVVYGALPPETRRQQAKLFNDPESGYDVLVASDAVGMGLNLNIGRIVFFSLHKYNGEDLDLVPPTMVKQIAGRAGRRNTSFAEGTVTTFYEADIKYLVDGLQQPLPCASSAGLAPVFEQMELFSTQVPDHTFAQVLTKFVETSRVDGNYFLCRTDNMRRLANSLEKITGLSLEDRFKFCFAPINLKDQEMMNYLVRFAREYSEVKPVQLGLPPPKVNFEDETSVKFLETRHQIASLYMWLSQQFSLERFPQFSTAEKIAGIIADLLAEGLTQNAQISLHENLLTSGAQKVHRKHRNDIVLKRPRLSGRQSIKRTLGTVLL